MKSHVKWYPPLLCQSGSYYIRSLSVNPFEVLIARRKKWIPAPILICPATLLVAMPYLLQWTLAYGQEFDFNHRLCLERACFSGQFKWASIFPTDVFQCRHQAKLPYCISQSPSWAPHFNQIYCSLVYHTKLPGYFKHSPEIVIHWMLKKNMVKVREMWQPI